MSRALIILLVLAAAGCQPQSAVDDDRFVPLAAAAIGLASAADLSPVPSPEPPAPGPQPGDVCPNCNGRGQVGDGRIMVKCLPCDGTGRVLESRERRAESGEQREPDVVQPMGNWLTDFDAATADALTHTRPVLVLISPPNCPQCFLLARDTLPDPGVQAELTRFTLAKIDGEQQPAVADLFRVTTYPTAVVYWPLDEFARVFTPPTDPAALVKLLRITAER